MKYINSTIAAILIFVTTSCIHDLGCKKMPKQTIGSGEIVNNAIIKDVPADWGENHVINSGTPDFTVSFDNGKTFQPIDFSKYTLLGKSADGGCEVVFERNVTKNTKEQKYIYTITVHECGMCKSLTTSMNWVLIPKIEDDFTVEFVVNYKRHK